MKKGRIFLWCLCFWFCQKALASDASEENWKVSFFKKYIEHYKALGSVSHESVAAALGDSFNQASSVAPDTDKHLVDAVRDQLAYFSNLQDKNEKDREFQKCQKGMKLVGSYWAKLAPEPLKAHFFVEKLVQESMKRKKNLEHKLIAEKKDKLF